MGVMIIRQKKLLLISFDYLFIVLAVIINDVIIVNVVVIFVIKLD